MAIDIEAMYGTIDPQTGRFTRLRYPLHHALLLPRTNVIALILSSDVHSSDRARNSWGAANLATKSTGTLVERLAESASERCHIFMRRGGEVVIAGWDDMEWWWRRESDPFNEMRFTQPPDIAPGRDAMIFQAPDPALGSGERTQALVQFEEGMY